MEEDQHGAHGPNTGQTLLALEDCIIPRHILKYISCHFCTHNSSISSVVQSVMKANDGEGSGRRAPGNADKIKCSNITALGVFHELNCDSHEKLASSALKMGEVSFPIYLMHDNGSGALAVLHTIPNSQLGTVVGHIYLDLATENGGMNLSTKGSSASAHHLCHISSYTLVDYSRQRLRDWIYVC
jgi:hypothetical protein